MVVGLAGTEDKGGTCYSRFDIRSAHCWPWGKNTQRCAPAHKHIPLCAMLKKSLRLHFGIQMGQFKLFFQEYNVHHL